MVPGQVHGLHGDDAPMSSRQQAEKSADPSWGNCTQPSAGADQAGSGFQTHFLKSLVGEQGNRDYKWLHFYLLCFHVAAF